MCGIAFRRKSSNRTHRLQFVLAEVGSRRDLRGLFVSLLMYHLLPLPLTSLPLPLFLLPYLPVQGLGCLPLFPGVSLSHLSLGPLLDGKIGIIGVELHMVIIIDFIGFLTQRHVYVTSQLQDRIASCITLRLTLTLKLALTVTLP